ncbi:hypothetical protein [Hyphomicrobium sp. MC1]|uniref:hypothetical protein n=1 Tax=Hyphomicrobium sp. (strain MC1) TaxID=717785 RepID=UPI000213DA8A|nr:hypothetical protein [Hyphomicrobium sp. MC1]CCB64431.1 protein of unknown function [Hyphomicrobium sp. MC1]
MMAGVTILRGEAPKGDGSGSGSGYGYGYGYVDGSGSGDGDGDSSGAGAGAVDGYGYGDGDGSGYGDGDGSGDGSGSGDGYYWRACIPYFSQKWTDAQRDRLSVLQAAGATIAYWRSDADGRPCNGGDGGPVEPGMVQKIPGPLRLCGSGALHATLMPPEWRGERWWIVALIGDVIEEGSKLGALEREIIGEAL